MSWQKAQPNSSEGKQSKGQHLASPLSSYTEGVGDVIAKGFIDSAASYCQANVTG